MSKTTYQFNENLNIAMFDPIEPKGQIFWCVPIASRLNVPHLYADEQPISSSFQTSIIDLHSDEMGKRETSRS